MEGSESWSFSRRRVPKEEEGWAETESMAGDASSILPRTSR